MTIISKSELAFKLALSNRKGTRAYTWLLAPYFTDDLLFILGMNREKYNSISNFTAKQTKIILDTFKKDFI